MVPHSQNFLYSLYNYCIYYPLICKAHDSSVETLLNMFLVWDASWPRYASYILLELFSYSGFKAPRCFLMIKGTDYVRMVFNGEQMLLPGCDADLVACTFDEFSTLVAKLTPSDTDCLITCDIPDTQ